MNWETLEGISVGVVLRHVASQAANDELHANSCGGGEAYYDYSQDSSEIGRCMETEARSAMTWEDAKNACALSGKRLPEPYEWVMFCSMSSSLGMTFEPSTTEWTGNARLTVDSYYFYAVGLRFGTSGCSEAAFQELTTTPKMKKFRCVK